MAGFEGMSSPRRHAGGLGSMPSKLLLFIIILVVLSACRSQRQSTETIAMAQRRQQQLLYRDTLWSQLSLLLENLTMEWLTDSLTVPPKTCFRLKADKAEASLRQQAQTEVQVTEIQEDTIKVDRLRTEATEPFIQEPSSHPTWRWRLLALGSILITGTLLILYKKHYGRSR